jgi:hypothetical protein
MLKTLTVQIIKKKKTNDNKELMFKLYYHPEISANHRCH